MNFYSFLLITYFSLFTYLNRRRNEWGIYLIILLLPSYLIRFQLLGIPFTLLEGMVLLLFAVWLAKEFKKIIIAKQANLPVSGLVDRLKTLLTNSIHRSISLSVTLLLLAATISVFVSPNLKAAAGLWKAYFVEAVIFFFLFIAIIKKDDQLKKVILFSSLSVLLLSLLAIFQHFTFWQVPTQWLAVRRVTSIFGFPNALGLLTAPLIIFLSGFLASQLANRFTLNKECQSNLSSGRPFLKNLKPAAFLVFLALTIITGLTAIIFTRSKGALLAILAGFVYYLVFNKRWRRYFLGLIAGLLLIASLIAVANGFKPIFSLKGTATVSGGGSLEIRLQQWRETLTMLKDRPIMGSGLAGYQTVIAPYHQLPYIEIFLYPHNIILNFWTETGLLGLIAFSWLVIVFYKIGLKLISLNSPQATQLAHGSMAAMTALLIHGLVDVPYFKNDLSLLFFLLVGIMVVVYNKHTSAKIAA